MFKILEHWKIVNLGVVKNLNYKYEVNNYWTNTR